MGNWEHYVVGIFVVLVIYIFAFGGAAMVGGKFDNWTSRLKRHKVSFKWKRKKLERY
nr:hypothetical protein [uncultured Mucilaginibacter sp.]